VNGTRSDEDDGRTPATSGPFGCIADDYTGATDVASGLRRHGLRTVLRFGEPPPDAAAAAADAIVVALKTRTAAPEDAVARSLAAQRWLDAQGARCIYFKYCSTFDSSERGNIGPVADALLDAVGAHMAVVCPASPEHGRTIYQGHLFVWDQPLAESPMRHHPLTPMTDSNLLRLLSRQTPHPVGLVAHDVVRQGAGAVAARLAALDAEGVRYAVVDAVSDDDLGAVAAACATSRLVTGAAGLAWTLGRLAGRMGAEAAAREAPLPHGPALILAGSCSAATLEQVGIARDRVPSLKLDPRGAAHDFGGDAIRWFDEHFDGRPLLVYSSAPPEERRNGSADVAARVEAALAALASHAVARGVRRLVVAGGETSGAVVDALGIRSVTVAGEEDTGVPWLVHAQPSLALLLKSGNLGRPDLFLRAVEGAA